MKYPKSIDAFFETQDRWRSGVEKLRTILASTELKEELKWGMPVYTLGGKNIAGIGSFKSYYGIWFYQGVFLKDPAQVLLNAQEGTTQALRQWRFTSNEEPDPDLIRSYILEAISNQKQGKELKAKAKKVNMPDELGDALKRDGELKKAFLKLREGARKEYMEYIGSAVRSATRSGRLEKVIPMILEGRGLNDKYK